MQGQPAHGRPAPAEGPSGRGRTVTAAIAGVLAVLTAVLWVTGGLKGQSRAPEKVAAGKAINQGRFTVTVREARTVEETESFTDKRERFLIVRMHITNNDKESASLFTDFTTGFTGVPKPGTFLPPDEVIGLTSSGETGDIQPGLPIDVEARWELAAGDTPRQITVALREWEFGAGFTILEKRWTASRNSPITATVTLPVVGP